MHSVISKKLIAKLKLGPLRQYRVALLAGLHPATLSKLVNGIEEVKPNDQRVIAIGKVLGLKECECFGDADAGKT